MDDQDRRGMIYDHLRRQNRKLDSVGPNRYHLSYITPRLGEYYFSRTLSTSEQETFFSDFHGIPPEIFSGVLDGHQSWETTKNRLPEAGRGYPSIGYVPRLE